MNRIIISVAFLLFSLVSLKAQDKKNNHFLNRIVAGTSLTYIWDNQPHDVNLPVSDEFFWESYTWNINAAVSVNKRMLAGIQVLNVFTSGTRIENEYYTIYGLFTQYDFFAKTRSKMSMFLEMSINRGDFCTCGNLDPYRKSNLWYHGLGFGFEFPLKRISERLFFDLSGYNYFILNKYKTKYNFTQYILGLNYHIGKKKK